MNALEPPVFLCPVCHKPLARGEKTYVCPDGHSYDIARQNYVNLLRSQQQGEKRHGDDRLMIRSRSQFLDKGFYNPLRDAVVSAAGEAAGAGAVVLDAGCGECFYTAAVSEHLTMLGMTPCVCGVDISREALIAGERRCRALHLAVASVFDLPLADASADIVLNLFAPESPEYLRVLRPGGALIRAVPLERHLWELKERIYDDPRPNKPEKDELDGLRMVSRREIRYRLRLGSAEDIMELFRMTPYYYKTGRADQEKAAALTSLDASAEFGLLVYTK